jgi:hypothetical protein
MGEVAMMTKLFCLLKQIAILFCGLAMFAQNHASAYEEIVPFYNYGLMMLYLENGRFRTDYETFRWKPDAQELRDWSYNYKNYLYNGRIYRKLSPHESKQFDAMPKTRAAGGKLYFDGKEIKTNAKVKYVYCAHYWNEGVIVVAETSLPKFYEEAREQIGFLDLQTGECNFVIPSAKSNELFPDFMVPVTIDTGNKDLRLDVAMPKTFSVHDRVECVISITNVSGKAILVPENLYDGLGICLYKIPDLSEKPWNRRVPLEPSETRTSAVMLEAQSICSVPGKRKFTFYWDGLLNPGSSSEISRFVCEEKTVELTGHELATIDGSNKGLVFDVKAPLAVTVLDEFDCIVSLKNVSGKPILVPDNLLSWLRVSSYYRIKKQKIDASSDGPLHRYPKLFIEPRKYTMLMPSETRESVLTLKAMDFIYFRFGPPYAKQRGLVFTFDTFLDPENPSELTRFTAERLMTFTLPRQQK